MLGVSRDTPAVFEAIAQRQTNMAALAQAALSRGTDRFTQRDLDGAIREFQRAIALDPTPENAARALELIAQTHLQQEQPDKAIAAYQRAVTFSPTSSRLRLGLGNIYFGLGRHVEARVEYQAALHADPTDSTAVFSLGQAAMAVGDYAEAESRFRQFIAVNPTNHGGYHALGQVCLKSGRPKEAIAALETALTLKHDFAAARVDLGCAWAELGDHNRANQHLRSLELTNPALADLLRASLTKIEPPRLLAAYSGLSFNTSAGVGTPVAALSPALVAANAIETFSLKFLFSKEMDPTSVQDVTRWSVRRAGASTPGGGYNWGMQVPATEALISPLPLSVIYDSDSVTATLFFVVRQNADANATLDPQHLVFRFSGVDSYANAMNPDADEFSGVSLIT